MTGVSAPAPATVLAWAFAAPVPETVPTPDAALAWAAGAPAAAFLLDFRITASLPANRCYGMTVSSNKLLDSSKAPASSIVTLFLYLVTIGGPPSHVGPQDQEAADRGADRAG